MLRTQAGKITSEEFKDILQVIKLYSTGRTLKAKRGRIPQTHKVPPEQLKAKNNNWKEHLREE